MLMVLVPLLVAPPISMVEVTGASLIFKVVAALPKLMVVAVASTSPKVVESVNREVVMVGEVPKTATPVPTSSDNVFNRTELNAVAAKLEEASVTTNLEAVTPDKVIVPLLDTPVKPEAAPAPVIS